MAIRVDTTKCIACGICVDRCLLDNLRVRIPPCRNACPLDINCQAYVSYIAMKRYDEAAETTRQGIPFARVLARVCAHPCENFCTRNEVDAPVAIRALKRFVTDRVPVADVSPPDQTQGKRVAIVGAGPAGLQAAWDLCRLGYGVTVFDEMPEPGGMMRLGIPEFRLPRSVLDQEISDVLRLGVRIQCNTRIGGDVGFARLREEFDAVFLAVGTHLSERLNVDHEEAKGVVHGMDFLREFHLGRPVSVGGKVLVVGGGNVAVDAALTARRLGADDVHLACVETRNQMPAFDWEVAQSLEEGVLLFCSWGPKQILTQGDAVRAVRLRRCVGVFDTQGRFAPSYDESQEMEVEVDTLIIAIGQSPDLSFLGSEAASGAFQGMTLRVDKATQATRIPGVFAGGDMTTGPASVVEAMAAGKRAAVSIDRYLHGQDIAASRDKRSLHEVATAVDTHGAIHRARAKAPLLPRDQRLGGQIEVEQTIDEVHALREAERCLRCGYAYEHYRECWYCLPCEIECPTEALKVEIPFLVA